MQINCIKMKGHGPPFPISGAEFISVPYMLCNTALNIECSVIKSWTERICDLCAGYCYLYTDKNVVAKVLNCKYTKGFMSVNINWNVTRIQQYLEFLNNLKDKNSPRSPCRSRVINSAKYLCGIYPDSILCARPSISNVLPVSLYAWNIYSFQVQLFLTLYPFKTMLSYFATT